MPFRRVAVALLLVLPAALATPGPGYQADGTLGPSAVVAGSFDDYYLSVAAGQTITAVATWDVGQGGLVLAISSNESLECVVPDVLCVAQAVVQIVEEGHVPLLCGPGRAVGGTFLAGSPQRVSLTSAAGGAYVVSVVGGAIPDRLAYHLHVDVDGATPAVSPDTGKAGAGTDGGLACALRS